MGRLGRRWEDEINEFLKSEEVEVEMTRNDMKHNNAWIEAAKNRERWRMMENDGERLRKDSSRKINGQRGTKRELCSGSKPTSTI